MNKIYLLSAVILLPLFLAAQSQRYYVDQLATGQNNGQSWTDAFGELHDALALAGAGDEIWVAKGTYRPSATGNRSARFQLLSGVRLYGSFAGTELDLSERDWAATPTALDGDIGNLGDSTDNAYNLLYLYRPDSLTVVDGFTFRYALANDSLAAAGEAGSSGAALYVMAFDGEAYPLVQNCIFEHNTASRHGGAVYIEGSGSGSVAPVFKQCRFTANRAVQGNGGALYRNGGSWVDRPEDLKSCIFEDNSAYLQGGAICFADSPRSDTFDISNTILKNNRVTLKSSGNLQGAAIQVRFPRSNGATIVSLRNSQLTRHNSGNGAIALEIGLDFSQGNLILEVDSCIFERNTGIAEIESLGWTQLFIKNSSFYKDSSGIRCNSESSSQSLLSNIIINKCFHFGLALKSKIIKADKIIWADCEDQNLMGSSNAFTESSVTLTNCVINNSYFVFANPTNPEPTSIVKFSNSVSNRKFITIISGTDVGIYNNIFNLYQNDPIYALPIGGPNGTVFDHNLINLPDTFNTANWIKTNNLWATDPQFVQLDSGDFRLQPCSPAIDAGTNAAVVTATDAVDQPRIQGDTVDIGAYEAPAFALMAAPVTKPACDGAANGSITASLGSVCEPLTVAWQSGNQSGATLDGLAPGLYQVTLTDGRGRSVAFSANVPITMPPVLYVQGSPISCFGANDGRASVQPLSGQPPFTYQWSPPVTTDSIATALPPGPASVTVTDAWGCMASFEFHVPEPDTLQFTATVQDASGPQSANGSIQVDAVTGGTAPYDYLWSPDSSMEPVLSNLTPGSYTLTVTDERGCVATWTFEVRYVSGTEEAAGQAVLLLYPNPAVESATVVGDLPDKMPAMLDLYDAAGRLIRTWHVPDSGAGSMWPLSLEGLAKGEYVVQLKDEQGRVIGSGCLVKL